MPVQTRSMSKALMVSNASKISKNSDCNTIQVSQMSYYDEVSSIDWDASKNKIIINQYGNDFEYDDMTIRQIIRKLYGPIHIHPDDDESIDAIDSAVSSLPLTQYTLTNWASSY